MNSLTNNAPAAAALVARWYVAPRHDLHSGDITLTIGGDLSEEERGTFARYLAHRLNATPPMSPALLELLDQVELVLGATIPANDAQKALWPSLIARAKAARDAASLP